MHYDIIIIGGGASGCYAAAQLSDLRPDLSIAIIEKTSSFLSKVKISGGGRCNITHHQFEPKLLSQNYPRGSKELLGSFFRYAVDETLSYFESLGVQWKAESDGRIFPVSDDAQTVIDALMQKLLNNRVKLIYPQGVKAISKQEDTFVVSTISQEYKAKAVIIATGSAPNMNKVITALGHKLVAAVPSLFTFHIEEPKLVQLQGVTAEVQATAEGIETDGPLLVTHWGLSGPAILKLSAWGARHFNEKEYKFELKLNWVSTKKQEVLITLEHLKNRKATESILKPQWGLSKRLWGYLIDRADLSQKNWAECSRKELQKLQEVLTHDTYSVVKKSTYKQEFVTAGGVRLKDVNLKTFESKVRQRLYFTGEVLNVDGITGGYNFQNAWTSAYLAASAIANSELASLNQ
ncbi:MAG: aminoacetone oxidase family FAD-binding enzyme [Flavobacteriaceae bacterium]|nr:aminoacetone oxidase family FAD-binding enzyme [Flavobacteriaceae bacterium]